MNPGTVHIHSPSHLPAAPVALPAEAESAPGPTPAGRGESSGGAPGELREEADGIRLSVSARGKELSEEEEREVEELRQRDREVRAHEAAHQGAAGSLATGGATFEYQTGPDGQRYAVGGEVNIDFSAIPGDPEATARKMEQVQRAALAPAEPSGQDRQVAAQAALEAQAARSEAATAQTEEVEEAGGCPVCGGSGHGAAEHEAPVDTFA